MAFNRVLAPTGGTDVTNWEPIPGGDAYFDDALPGQDIIYAIPGGSLIDISYVVPTEVPIGLSGDYITRNIYALHPPGGTDLGTSGTEVPEFSMTLDGIIMTLNGQIMTLGAI